MDCQEFRNYLLDYLDNETSNSVSQAVEEHLIGCTHCRSELDAFKKTNMLIQLRNVPQPDESYWDKTYAAIEEKLAASIIAMPLDNSVDDGAGNEFLRGDHQSTNWYKRISYVVSIAAMVVFIVAGYWLSNAIAEKPDEEYNTVIVVEPEWRSVAASQNLHTNFQPDADFSKFSGAAMGIISPVSQGIRAEAVIK